MAGALSRETAPRLSLGRADYVRHPLLLGSLLVVEAAGRIASGPVWRTLAILAGELKVEVCHREALRKMRALRAQPGPVRLNLGCGAQLRSGWMNVDLDPRADVRLDIRRPLPLPDASVAEIYAEHVLEHLAYPGQIETVLRDWRRVLVPGGLLSVGVPETAGPLRAYVAGERGYFDWCRTQPWNPAWIETQLDQINFHFRQQALGFGQDHLYAYDGETLTARLTSAGFTDIAQRPYDPARDSRPGTLYVDARKPRG